MKLQVSEPYQVLFDPNHESYAKRYLVFYGGRGAGKSIAVAQALLLRGTLKKERILCTREYQSSIADSVLKVLADQVDAMGLSNFYKVQNNGIFGINGTEFLFKGLRHNIQSIKSTAGVTICWIEEGQTVSEDSYKVLVPTIREEGSQIIITFNPDLEDDPTYQRFVINPPQDSFVRKVNFDENKFFPEVLLKELNYDRNAKSEDVFNNIWYGDCLKAKQGLIYAEYMAKMDADGRLTTVPYNPSAPVITAWDLGYSDSTAIWFCQLIGKEPRLIDYYENNGQALDHYVRYLKDKPYSYDAHILPHDAGHSSLRTGTTIQEQIEAMGLKNTEVLPVDAIDTGIELVRQLLPQLWVDKDKCNEGVAAIKKYRYKYDDDRKSFSIKPVHDWTSHCNDALRYLATYLATQRNDVAINLKPSYNDFNSQSWMS